MEVYEAALNGSFLKRDVRDMCIRTALICFFLQSVISFAAPVIVLPDNPAKLVFPPGETQAYAADFLNKILAEAIGQKLEIVPESCSEKYPVSFVTTDPKGGLISEVGAVLEHYGYKIRSFNTINFRKSMHYNPFEYVHSEKDVLKLVNALITNTKGDGKSGDEFWTKAETLWK